MTKKYFGTDGIRGSANEGKITADKILKVGQAVGVKFQRGEHTHRVIISKDTRLSGYMIENALTAGLISVGMDVIILGPMPTPAVAMLTKSMRADLGVMISASHNPYHDNGLKFFGPDGYKLSDSIENDIESLMEEDLSQYLAESDKIGKATRIDDASGRYIEFVKNTFPRELSLEGLKVVIDCANGAAYKIGPTILWELGAEVVAMGVTPNGFNINDNCGATAPLRLAKAVTKNKADIGIALDGDADRLIVCDDKGNIIDGDQIIALISENWHENNKLKGGGVVTTKMSNLALEQYLKNIDLTLARTNVGDRYVTEYMREKGFNIGGEQSGHIILSDYSTTGDGLVAALQVLACIQEKRLKSSQISNLYNPMPQILRNVKCEANIDLSQPAIVEAIENAEQQLAENGRVLVRKSGTEPIVRVMIEGLKTSEITKLADSIVAAIEQKSAIPNKITKFKNAISNFTDWRFRLKWSGRSSG
ncbi:MAG: phosphoglucosamine mutase [Rickettsiales bacterium]|nr:phosphoglucosamine mutase [Rickettsiales bacterium]